jgi:hypothetical protein
MPLSPHKHNGTAAMVRSLWTQVFVQHMVHSIWNGFTTMNRSTEINVLSSMPNVIITLPCIGQLV